MTDTPTPAVPGAMAMTEERLADEFERLDAAASPGPYHVSRPTARQEDHFVGGGDIVVCEPPEDDLENSNAAWPANMALLVSLRNNVPTIIAALRELTRLRAQVRECEPLVAACESEFCGDVTDDAGDNEPVMSGMDGGSTITFGMIRRARAALTPQPAPTGSETT